MGGLVRAFIAVDLATRSQRTISTMLSPVLG
jgi:hypothetical protein